MILKSRGCAEIFSKQKYFNTCNTVYTDQNVIMNNMLQNYDFFRACENRTAPSLWTIRPKPRSKQTLLGLLIICEPPCLKHFLMKQKRCIYA